MHISHLKKKKDKPYKNLETKQELHLENATWKVDYIGYINEYKWDSAC